MDRVHGGQWSTSKVNVRSVGRLLQAGVKEVFLVQLEDGGNVCPTHDDSALELGQWWHQLLISALFSLCA